MDDLDRRLSLKRHGENLLRDIDETKDILSSASNWGVADIFLKSGLISWIKQGKIRKAEARMKEIQRSLMSFKGELESINFDVREISMFESFIDIFFDNLFIDIFIQSKISNKIQDLDKLENQIKNIMKELSLYE